MGVMSCSRSGCESIMCDTYILEVGYICYKCQHEFKEYVGGSELENESQIISKLKDFMDTEANQYYDSKISIDDFFKQNTH